MAKLRLTVATGDYDFIRPLKEGAVSAEGLELIFLTDMRTPEFVGRMVRRREFDVAEMGLNFTVTAASRGEPEGLIGLPIFPLRRFQHGVVFVNPAAGIKSPRDLIGRKVGNLYQAAGNVWVRGVLQEYHDVPYSEVKWVSQPWVLSHLTPSWHETPEPGRPLLDLLREGKLAGLIRSYVSLRAVREHEGIAYLFPDYKSEEVAYFKKSGIFPILHALNIKREIVEAHPWVATSLLKAFDRSRRVALRRPLDARIAFHRAVREEQEELLGPDPWQYGLGEANRRNIETFLRYAYEQEMTERELAVDELFAPFDADTIKDESEQAG